jgi:hypothetical protein
MKTPRHFADQRKPSSKRQNQKAKVFCFFSSEKKTFP